MKHLEQNFGPFVAMSPEAVFVEHRTRAIAYLACCQPSGTIDSLHFGGFIYSYSSVKDQMNIIHECAAQYDNHLKSCSDGLQRLAEARQGTEK